jgi:hypothetical protein
VLQGIRERQEPEIARRVIALYEFMRAEGARMSFGTSVDPNVVVWLGEHANPGHSNPISLSFYPGGVGVNFRFLVDRRTEDELRRLVNLLRRVPGTQPLLEGVEDRQFRVYTHLAAAEVLASDEALDAFKYAVAQAVQPPRTA